MSDTRKLFLEQAGEMVGKLYGKLTITGVTGSGLVRAVCACGAPERDYRAACIRKFETVSCGCHRAAHLVVLNKTHGLASSPEYNTWVKLRQRCSNQKDKSYSRYGGRGISVCERWNASFDAFYADMGPRPSPKHSIDRFPNNDGDYEQGNCRWATQSQQGRNKRSNRHIQIFGRTQTLVEWANEAGVTLKTLWYRLDAGWPPDIAVTTPTGKRMGPSRMIRLAQDLRDEEDTRSRSVK